MLGHGGSIWLETEPGHGTTFEVLLPRIAEGVPGASVLSEPEGASASAHLLVVDDDPQVRAVFVQMLELAGYSVSCAGDGQEAIDLFRSAPTTIDGVLLDLNMPRLNGHEVFLRLREIQPGLPVVLTSGFAEGDVMERFAGEGFAGFVHKPTQMRVLFDAVAAALTPTYQE
ncbi:MAG: CheY-like chemotaxis protein [Pseudohongiellaceae bacterium]